MIINIYPHIAISGNTQIVIADGGIQEDAEGFCIHFNLHNKYKKRDALKAVSKLIKKSSIDWIKPKNNEWIVDSNLAKKQLPNLAKFEWFTGMLYIEPDLDIDETEIFDEIQQESVYKLFILKEEVLMKANNKIFLSHKGINKPLIREYNLTLKLIGFDTWIDEDAMNAGASLDRSLLEGMKLSCAAIFFITPDFNDDGYLETEIDYAIQQKREKGNDFQIITLSLLNESGIRGVVPELLRRYVWKEPNGELEGLREILKSIPLVQHKPTRKA